MFRIIIAAVFALCSATFSYAKSERSKDGLEYLGLSRVPETGEIKEIFLESSEPTSEKNAFFITYRNYSSSTAIQNLSAVVYCDDKNPRIVTELASGTIKPDLTQSQDADTRMYDRVCGKSTYKRWPAPSQTLQNGPVQLWGVDNNVRRVALDSKSNVTNLFKIENLEAFKNYLFFCNNDYPSMVLINENNRVMGYEEISRLANSKNDVEFKRGRVISTTISKVCPNVTSLSDFVLSKDEFFSVIQKDPDGSQPPVSFPNALYGNSDGTPQGTVRSVYGQYLLAKVTCENDAEGEYRLDELRGRMTEFDKWVNSQGLDGARLWKEAAAASEKNIFHLGARMNSMLPDELQAASNCRSVVNLAMSAVNDVLRGSGGSVEKDF